MADIKKIFSNLATFGATYRVDKKTEELLLIQKGCEDYFKKIEDKRNNVNLTLEELIAHKKKALLILKKMEKLINNVTVKDRKHQIPFINTDLSNNTEFIKNAKNFNFSIKVGEQALNIGKGAFAGVSTAVGTWALVGAFGSASTGTAISSLAGAAATNATLAWLGGGSLASGGLGIAGGTVVLGGLAAIPALAISAIFSHVSAGKKIKKIEETISELKKYIEDGEHILLKLEFADKYAKEMGLALDKEGEVFVIELEKIKKEIYPNFLIYLLKKLRKVTWRMLHRIIEFNSISKKDSERIFYIYKIAIPLKDLMDKPIFDENGDLTK